MRIQDEDLDPSLGGFFLDLGINYLDSSFPSQIKEAINNVLKSNSESYLYERVYKLAVKKGKPLIFGDVAPETYEESLRFLAGSQESDILNYINTTLIASILASFGFSGAGLIEQFGNKISRRDFLKKIAKGVGWASLFTSYHSSTMPLLALADGLGIDHGSKVYEDFAAIAHDLLHPESYLITMRNIIWALKIRDLYEKGIIPKEEVIHIVGGWMHRYLGFFLKYPEIAKNYFKLFKYGEVIKKFFPNTTDFVHKSCIYYPDGTIKYVEHEEMKELIS